MIIYGVFKIINFFSSYVNERINIEVTTIFTFILQLLLFIFTHLLTERFRENSLLKNFSVSINLQIKLNLTILFTKFMIDCIFLKIKM
jgi:hypothetical protein